MNLSLDVSRETFDRVVLHSRTNRGGPKLKHLAHNAADVLLQLCIVGKIDVSETQRTILLEYLDELIEMNSHLNLTRIVDPAAAIRLHLVDSILCLPEFIDAPPGPLCDIGTGGGLPGVPLCVVTGRKGRLLDSVTKKADALNQMLVSLRLDSSILAVPERSELHALAHPSSYAVVTARAVSSLPALVEMASPLLAQGGVLIAMKGFPDQAELERGRVVAGLVGMQEVGCRELLLPGGVERRTVVSYRKTAKSRVRLPRRPGQAHHTPLA